MAILTEVEAVREVFKHSTVAVLGAHLKEHKAAYYVPDYLHKRGYTLYPVNPVFAGKTLWSNNIVSSLSELATPVDIVNVFRRSDHLAGHLDDILTMNPRPKVVWFQLGIRNDEVAEQLSGAGIDVVQNRCMLADHQRLL